MTKFKCKSCIHSKFDDIWGEYKCLLLHKRVHDPKESQECKKYTKGKSAE